MYSDSIEVIALNVRKPKDLRLVTEFLAKHQLDFDGDTDYTIGLFKDNDIVATGSVKGNLLRNIAIDDQLQGSGLLAKIMQTLMDYLFNKGFKQIVLFTKPKSVKSFESFNFSLLAQVTKAAMLEYSWYKDDINSYIANIKAWQQNLPKGNRAGIVMNANPFTQGHLKLVELAASENAAVVVMVVEENKSQFDFAERLELVKRGCAHLDNVFVIASGRYVVSSTTFPAYFTKGSDTLEAQTQLDATIYAKYIAPALGVGIRYVGEEPYCPTTSCYNNALCNILPQYGIKFKMIPRYTAGDIGYISASKVREMWQEHDMAKLQKLVPQSSYQYLQEKMQKENN